MTDSDYIEVIRAFFYEREPGCVKEADFLALLAQAPSEEARRQCMARLRGADSYAWLRAYRVRTEATIAHLDARLDALEVPMSGYVEVLQETADLFYPPKP
jgi:hypothetical protein